MVLSFDANGNVISIPTNLPGIKPVQNANIDAIVQGNLEKQQANLDYLNSLRTQTPVVATPQQALYTPQLTVPEDFTPSQRKDSKTVGGFLKNMGKRPGELFTGLTGMLTNPGEVVGDILSFYGDESVNLPRKALGAATLGLSEAIPAGITGHNLGETTEMLLKDPKQLLKDTGDYIYNTGGVDLALTVAPGVPKRVSKAVGAGVKKVARKAPAIDDFFNKREAIQNIREQFQKDINKARKTELEISKDLNKIFKGVDNASISKISESFEEGGVQLTPFEQELKNQIRPIMEKYDDVMAELDPHSATVGRETEIVQYDLRTNGTDLNYAQTRNNFDKFFEAMDVVDKDGNVIKKGTLPETWTEIPEVTKGPASNDVQNVYRGKNLEKDLKNLERQQKETGTKIERTKGLQETTPEVQEIVRKYLPETTFKEFLNMNVPVDTIMQNVKRNADRVKREKLGMKSNLENLVKLGGDVEAGVPRTELVKGNYTLSPENYARLTERAVNGDLTAERFLKAYDAVNKGDLYRIPHGHAPVIKQGEVPKRAERKGYKETTERVYGNAKYDDIAIQLRYPDEWLSHAVLSNVFNRISNMLMDNSFFKPGEGPMSKDIAPNKIYAISKEELKKNGIEATLDVKNARTLKDVPELKDNPDYVLVDKGTMEAMQELFGKLKDNNKLFKQDWLNGFVSVAKGALVSSGAYIGGNLTSGAFNMIVNSNIHLLDDIINSIKSRGALLEEVGMSRRIGMKNVGTTPGRKAMNTFNRINLRDKFTAADASLQNFFGEVAAQAEMRRKGIVPEERLAALKNLSGEELVRLMDDISDAALIYGDNKLISRSVMNNLKLFQPFVEWQSKALQSTMNLYKRHPILMGYMGTEMLGKLGWDKELQNRLNLSVNSDKHFVNYVLDPKTKNIREVSMEAYAPITAAKLMFGTPEEKAKALMGTGNIAGLANIIDAVNPTFTNGRAPRRVEEGVRLSNNGKSRQKFNPETGEWEDMGKQWDEVLAKLIRGNIGVVNFINKTAAPIVFGSLGKPYLQPLEQSVFGGIDPDRGDLGPTRNFANAGDVGRPRTASDVLKGFATIYERDYQEPLRPGTLDKSTNRYNRARDKRAYSNYLNLLEGSR